MLGPRAGHGRTSTLARCSAPFPQGKHRLQDSQSCRANDPAAARNVRARNGGRSLSERSLWPCRGRAIVVRSVSYRQHASRAFCRGSAPAAAAFGLPAPLRFEAKLRESRHAIGPPPSGSGYCSQSESGDALRNSATVGNSSPPQDTSGGQLAALADPPFRPRDHASQPASTVMPTSCAGCRCNSPRNHCLSRLFSRRSDQPRPLSGVSSTAIGTGTKSLVSGLQANAAASTTFPPRSDSTT